MYCVYVCSACLMCVCKWGVSGVCVMSDVCMVWYQCVCMRYVCVVCICVCEVWCVCICGVYMGYLCMWSSIRVCGVV